MPDMTLSAGSRIGKYDVLAPLDAGGMGEVFRARDRTLERDVALKVLPARFALDRGRLARFAREARVLASLNHPNVATLHEVLDVGGVPALVLELVDGQTLADRIAAGPLPPSDAIDIALQIAAALMAAHEHGVVHRDLKPHNIKIRRDGTVKLLDFGLAKVLEPSAPGSDLAASTWTVLETAGNALGTPAYMSPEQARGADVDERADIWAFGCVLYEMLTGRRAFGGTTVPDCIVAVLEREPDWSALPAASPPLLERLLRRCLAKDRNARLRHIGDARLDLAEAMNALTSGSAPAPARARHSSAVAVRLGLYVAFAAAAGGLAAGLYFWSRDTDARWLAEEMVPRIEAALDVADWESAYVLAKEAEARVPESAELAELWPRLSWRVSIPSEPAGAMVYRQAFDRPDAEWEALGRTPLENIRFPLGLSRLRFELEGHRPLLRALGGAHVNWRELREGNPVQDDQLFVGPVTFTLDRPDTLPADKVRVPGWTLSVGGVTVPLRDFFLGRYEVTNAEYKTFVDAGGYQTAAFWDPVVVDGETIPWERAMGLFVDRTGRPGPSTWEAGDYREGEGELPVSGVSWYEAAAYARFVGQELPTAHHWQQAVANAMFPWLLPVSRFGGDGPRRVADSRAMTHVGAYDMAGNVREWTASALGSERIILGGSWNEAYYIAGVTDSSAPPLDRSASNGFRLAMTGDDPAIAAQARAPLQSRTTVSPVLRQEPVSDDVYHAYSRVFDYDRRPLNPAIESTHPTRVWIRERIRLDAAYSDEQMRLHLYLPTGGSPPYQTVVYWPGWDTFGLDDIDEYFARQMDFVVKSGRAVVFPIYKGTFERRVGTARVRPSFNTAAYRDNTIDTVKDMRRTIDYLETREDVDTKTLAFFGYSWGGVNGPTALAQEPRLRVAVIDIGLLPPMESIPAVDPVNALPRVRVPVVLLSSEFDAMVPVANARRYFELLGTPPRDKRHVMAIGGHFIPRERVIRETLDWLDKHLGPARR
jgi:formylglycine-generating enzyme required for sulfatase activity/dienelactone hydrolase